MHTVLHIIKLSRFTINDWLIGSVWLYYGCIVPFFMATNILLLLMNQELNCAYWLVAHFFSIFSLIFYLFLKCYILLCLLDKQKHLNHSTVNFSHRTFGRRARNQIISPRLCLCLCLFYFSLLYNADDIGTFKSARWNRFYKPDLCFVFTDSDGEAIPETRKIFHGFPNSQHRPVIIHVGM